jgi:putative ABC transport system ATP-binding protein
VRAIDGVDLDVRTGEFVAITGPSASGKSTTLSILGCLELPSDGEYRIEGIAVQGLAPDVLAALRNVSSSAWSPHARRRGSIRSPR